MKKIIALLFTLSLAASGKAFVYPTFDKTLPNGLKVIVCQKQGTGFAEVEVWYRVGSKDESDGIRGMAHMFEHMMFRGTKNFPFPRLTDMLDSVGGQWNAYTTFDRTVYHEFIPNDALAMAIMLEADRMANLNVTQDILNTERQVVGEEYRNGMSNWYQKMVQDRYAMLYPQGHPYAVDVIGHLDEITNFTAPQCMDFYNKFYSPNNAFLVITGDVNPDEVFKLAEKYFGVITKQLPAVTAGASPDLMSSHVNGTDMNINFPLQIFCFSFPQPAASDKDYFAFSMMMSLLFTDENSLLNEKLIMQDHSAYAIQSGGESMMLYPSRTQMDIFMPPMPGNVKVKREIRAAMDSVIANGLPQDRINDFISNYEASRTTDAYSSESIANDLGMAEYYFHDYKRADSMVDDYKKVTQDDIKRVAAKYLSPDHVDIVNIKPSN